MAKCLRVRTQRQRAVREMLCSRRLSIDSARRVMVGLRHDTNLQIPSKLQPQPSSRPYLLGRQAMIKSMTKFIMVRPSRAITTKLLRPSYSYDLRDNTLNMSAYLKRFRSARINMPAEVLVPSNQMTDAENSWRTILTVESFVSNVTFLNHIESCS